MNILILKMEDKESNFTCGWCFKVFTKNISLKVHKDTVHDNIRKYECRKCDKSFKRSHHLKSHIVLIHENLKKYECEFCEKDLICHLSRIFHSLYCTEGYINNSINSIIDIRFHFFVGGAAVSMKLFTQAPKAVSSVSL